MGDVVGIGTPAEVFTSALVQVGESAASGEIRAASGIFIKEDGDMVFINAGTWQDPMEVMQTIGLLEKLKVALMNRVEDIESDAFDGGAGVYSQGEDDGQAAAEEREEDPGQPEKA